MFFNIIKVWLAAILFYLLVGFSTKYYFLMESRAVIIFYFFFLLCCMLLFHFVIIPGLLEIYYRSPQQKVLCKFIGSDEYKSDFKNFINKHSILGLSLSSSVGEEDIAEDTIQEYFLYSNAKSYSSLYKEIKRHLTSSKPLHVVSKLFDRLNLKWEWSRFDGLPIYTFQRKNNDHIRKFLRRTIDICGSIGFMILLSPFLLIIALAIKLDSKGPIIFKQKRCGFNGKHFTFYKFRSMVEGENKDAKREMEFRDYLEVKTAKGKILNHDDVTQVGSLLRKTSLDELPQLWNVLLGQMSLVGPRPPIFYEVKHYKNWHKDRLAIKPGLTGLWQVHGRGNLPSDHSVFLDLMYVINRSLSLDIKLLFQTIQAVIWGKGAY